MSACAIRTLFVKFVKVFDDAVDRLGMVAVLKHGFKHRGIAFKGCVFPAGERAEREWSRTLLQERLSLHSSIPLCSNENQTIDMVLDINGIPVVGIELKDQFTGQDVEDAMRQWSDDRDSRCRCLKFNRRA